MDPVDSPWIGLVSRVLVRGVRRNDDELRWRKSRSLPIDLDPAAAFHIVNDDMLAASAGALDIVEFRLGIVADVGDIDLPGHRITGKKIGRDLLWKNDEPLTLEAPAFTVCMFLKRHGA